MRRNLRFEIFPLKVRSYWRIQPGGSDVNAATEGHYLLKRLSLSSGSTASTIPHTMINITLTASTRRGGMLVVGADGDNVDGNEINP